MFEEKGRNSKSRIRNGGLVRASRRMASTACDTMRSTLGLGANPSSMNVVGIAGASCERLWDHKA